MSEFIIITRTVIVIIMLVLLVAQIFEAIKNETDKVLLICVIIQIFNVINLALGAVCNDE